MRNDWRWHFLAAVGLLAAGWARPAQAYIGGPPTTLGLMCSWSTHVMVVRVERVDREKNVILFRKVREVRGKWPTEVVKQIIPANLAERQRILEWAEVGKTTVTFALQSYRWGHTYIDSCWYCANTADWEWWNIAHSEPLLLRMYSGMSDRLVDCVNAILAGKEIIVPGLVGDNQNELRQGRAKVQRLKASLKLSDYNPKRDVVGPGGDDFAPLAGMPGFSQYSSLPGGGADPQAIAGVDMDGDGRPDLCLAGPTRVVLMLNRGDYLTEVHLPGFQGGCRAAVWADYNGDGKPDLLLATPAGPRLFTNLGQGEFRDDTFLLPVEPAYNLTSAAWIDHDGDGLPDLLLGNGFHGLRLYRNKGKAEPLPKAAPPAPGKPLQPPPPVPPASRWFEDLSTEVGLGPDGIGGSTKGDSLTVCDVNGDGRPDFLYGAGSGMLVLNTGKGFALAKDSGIAYRPGKVGPVFGDFDNDGHPDLLVPQDGGCKLFRNDGTGRFTDVTGRAGDLARFVGQATSAAWGDLDNDGRLDLVIGCLRGPNRYFRNKGNGAFEDAGESLGLHKRIFNTQAVALLDLNGDGVLDVVFHNEGRESAVLLGSGAVSTGRTPVTLQVAGTGGVVGSKVRILDREGKVQATEMISGGDGRGGQTSPQARFLLAPRAYQVEVRYTSGIRRSKPIVVASAPIRGVIDDQTPRVE